MKTFPGNSTVAVGQTNDGRFAVIFTILDLPSEAYANTVREHLEAAFADKIRALGGKLDRFEPVPLPRNIVRG